MCMPSKLIEVERGWMEHANPWRRAARRVRVSRDDAVERDKEGIVAGYAEEV